MASITRTISNFSLTSTWKAYRDYRTEERWYSTPTTAASDKTFDLSAIPTGSKITAASLAVKTNGEGDSAATRSGTSYNITNDHTGSNAINVISWFSGLTSFGSESIRFSFKAYGGTGTGTESGSSQSRTCNVSNVALTVTYSPPNSSFSMSGFTNKSAAIGSTITMTIVPADSAYSHRITYSLGGSTVATRSVAAGTTTDSVQIPASWANSLPNATSGTLTIQLDTLSGSTVVGSASNAENTVTIPDSDTYKPSIGSITAALVRGSAPSTFTEYLQNDSKVKLTLSSVSGAYGSSISSIKYEGWGGSATTAASTTTYTTPTLTMAISSSPATVTLKATVTDTRGRTANKTVNISVYAYQTPSFSLTAAYRSNASGTAQDDGTYVKAAASINAYFIGGKNTYKVKFESKQTTGSSYTTKWESAYLANTSSFSPAAFSGYGADYSYHVRITVTDLIGNSASIVRTVSSAHYTLHFRNGGNNVGILSAADTAYGVKVGGSLYATGKLYSEGNEVATNGNIKLSADDITSGTLPVARGGTGQASLAALRNAAGLGNTTGALPVANGGTGQTTIDGVKSAFGISKSALGFVQQQAIYQTNNAAVSANSPMFNVTLSLASGDTWEGIAILGVGGATETDFLAFFDADYTVANYRSFMRYNASSTQSGKNMFGYAQASGVANKSITHFTIQKLGDVVYMQGQTLRGGNALADFVIARSGISGSTFQIVPNAAVASGHGSMLRMTKIY